MYLQLLTFDQGEMMVQFSRNGLGRSRPLKLGRGKKKGFKESTIAWVFRSFVCSVDPFISSPSHGESPTSDRVNDLEICLKRNVSVSFATYILGLVLGICRTLESPHSPTARKTSTDLQEPGP